MPQDRWNIQAYPTGCLDPDTCFLAHSCPSLSWEVCAENRLTWVSAPNISSHAQAVALHLFKGEIYPHLQNTALPSKVRPVSTHLVDSAASLNRPWRRENSLHCPPGYLCKASTPSWWTLQLRLPWLPWALEQLYSFQNLYSFLISFQHQNNTVRGWAGIVTPVPQIRNRPIWDIQVIWLRLSGAWVAEAAQNASYLVPHLVLFPENVGICF